MRELIAVGSRCAVRARAGRQSSQRRPGASARRDVRCRAPAVGRRRWVEPEISRMRLLVTGGAGFIGSYYVRSALSGRYLASADAEVVVLDLLTYAGTLTNL